MTTDHPLTRRSVLLAGAAGGAAVLAACASNSAADPDPTPATRGGAGSTKSGSGGNVLATLADLQVGQAVSVQLPGGGGTGLVCRVSATQAACFSAVCPHEGCAVPAGTKVLTCPCHGSQFDAETGAVLRGPAATGLAKVAVTVSDGHVIAT